MDEPIYREVNGRRIKMVSINEGRRMTDELITTVRRMKELGEWDDELKRQKLDDKKSPVQKMCCCPKNRPKNS